MQFNCGDEVYFSCERVQAKLARILQDREEGFVRDGQLAGYH